MSFTGSIPNPTQPGYKMYPGLWCSKNGVQKTLHSGKNMTNRILLYKQAGNGPSRRHI